MPCAFSEGGIMTFHVPSIHDILAAKIQDISARLPVPMAGTGMTESASFASELAQSAQQAAQSALNTAAQTVVANAAQTPAQTPAVTAAQAAALVAAQGAGQADAYALAQGTLQSGTMSATQTQTAAESALAALAQSLTAAAARQGGTPAASPPTTASPLWPRLDINQLQAIQPRMDAAISSSAASTGLDPALLRALIAQESAFQPYAISSAGAMGLTQLMPGTAEDLGVSDPYNIEQNIQGGAQYLSEQLQTFGGDLSLALAAYNVGPNAVKSHGGVPPFQETKDFIDKVLTYYSRYRISGSETR
jgi:soluble lytic murein transglycosylase-like protein